MNKARQLIAGLLSVYMLTLVVLPCNDNCETDSHSFPSNIRAAQEHHEHEKDMCSPFCVCACCATSVSIAQYQTNLFSPDYSAELFSSYKESSYSAFAVDVWQPPRFS